MYFKKPLIFACLVLGSIWIGFSSFENKTSSEWKLIKKKKNISIYSRLAAGNLKELRIIATFETDVEQFMAELNNPERYIKWVYKCSSSTVLKHINENEFYYYTSLNFPFPTTDRDLVAYGKQWVDQEGVIHSTSVGKPNFIPKANGLVRIPTYNSYWKISPIKDGKIHIDYQSKSDPGGRIPTWIVNLALTTGPLKSMRSLEKLVSKK